ncbi:hypothetical protein [Wenjunlia tyrosinilytica]|nr:hypothetical protein [Wenjunlia tyrosinilytica]
MANYSVFLSRSAAAAALVAAVVLPAAVPAVAAPAQRGTSVATHAAAVIDGHAPSLHPEGIDYDPLRHRFVVTSLRHGTVSVVDRDGSVRTLVDDPRNISTIGVRVDAARRRVLVAAADPGVGERTSPATQGHTAVVAAYSLDDGHELFRTDLAALLPGENHFANDIAIAGDGTAYVTDSFSPTVYRVDRGGRATVLAHDERLRASAGFGANGIVLSPRGFLIVGKYDDGRIFRVDTKDGSVSEVALDKRLAGKDGFALRPDGSLVVVHNALGAPDGADKVTVLRADCDWTRARVTREVPWPDTAPTAAAVVGGQVRVLSGALDILLGGHGTADTFTIRRLP